MPNQYTYRLYDPVPRFWSKVNKDGPIPIHRPELGQCWEWVASCYKCSGYGQFGVKTKKVTAHRFSWELLNGKVLNGLFVLHKCDNRKCVNPQHLFLGTAKDNTQDMMSKNRHPRISYYGDTNPHHKLTQEQVRFIRDNYVRGKNTYKHFATMFNVSVSCICSVITRDSWLDCSNQN